MWSSEKKKKKKGKPTKQHMVPVISLLANPELETIYIGGTAEAAETEGGAVYFHPNDKFGILLARL